MKVPDQEIYCVDFKRKSGSYILFNYSANQYIEYLDDSNNFAFEDDYQWWPPSQKTIKKCFLSPYTLIAFDIQIS